MGEHKMRALLKSLIVAGLTLSSGSAFADKFPEKAVTLVIPQSPGSSSDILGRYLADGLSKLWGQPVVVENRPGAEGMIGSARVVNAKPDGYTLLINSSSLGVNAALAEKATFDAVNDLKPVGLIATGDFVILTGSRIPLPTLKDVVEKAKTQKVFAGITGGVGELVTKLFEREAKVKLEPVQYKSPPEALLDLGGGRVDFFVTSLTTYLASATLNKSTVVAVTSPTRATELPNVPTAIEAGFPGVVAETWWGLLAPGKIAPELAAQINADVTKVLSSDAALSFLRTNRARPITMDAEKTAKFVRDDLERTKSILKAEK